MFEISRKDTSRYIKIGQICGKNKMQFRIFKSRLEKSGSSQRVYCQ